MECNRDEALRAREIAERKFAAKDVAGAKKFALKAQNLFPALEGISQMIATLDIHLSAGEEISEEKDWYGILCVSPSADDEMVKKQYRKLALMLHPDKNKSIGAEAAFKLVSEAWSVLSDKTRRMDYDQKRNASQLKVLKSHTSSNGCNYFPNHASSNLRAQKNTARSGPAIPPLAPPNTFWTSCNRCKMQYEYLRIYINHNLLCPNCHEAFLASETRNPTNGYNSTVHWQQAPSSSNAYGHRKKSKSKAGLSASQYPANNAATTQAANMVNHTYDNVKKHQEEKEGTATGYEFPQRKSNVPQRTTVGNSSVDRKNPSMFNVVRSGKKRSITDTFVNDRAGHASDGNASVSQEYKNVNFTTVLQANGTNSGSGARMAWKQSNSLNKDLSSFDIRNMLMQKAKSLVKKKLDDWNSAFPAKSAQKEIMKQKQKTKLNEKEIEKSASCGDAVSGVVKVEMKKFQSCIAKNPDEKASFDNSHVGSDKKVLEPISIDVPDPDFHDFDKDRSEKSFGSDQVWATYDDEDGMPRYYVLIQKVMSLNPFKIRMSFLNSKTNSEFGMSNWVSMGFAKTCGDFRVGRYETNDHINIFSHKVRWQKGARGIIKILPCKGDTWALYRNWSSDWNEGTPDATIYKYDMVEVLDDYNEEQGVSVAPLVKVAGFKTVFHRHHDQREVKRIPREEMFRFSHQVPSYLLTGMESDNAPKGCHELDPAASPMELLQVVAEAKNEELGEVSDR